MPNDQHQYDVLVIGSGASGLSLALQIAEYADVAVLSKAALSEGATLYAQGGISAVLDVYDTIDSHVEDTLKAGAGLCNQEIVRFVVEQGRESIQWLIDIGVNFTKNPIPNGHEYHLHQEGGHSHRRIIHAADSTGKEIENTLEGLVRVHPRISLFDHHTAVDLITAAKLGLTDNRCLGAYVYDQKHDKVKVFRARFTVLATGGAGKVYLYTSNPDICTGDGIAIACRAGCRVANMEFIQFHPTCLYHPEAKSFLLSEALRGEGAKLRLPDGQSFLDKYDSREELAPRDIVARAIDQEMKRLGTDCIFLDISHRPKDFIIDHFPTIYARCLQYGFDLTAGPVPVVPAAHYTCGGVLIDRNGLTDISGLYAIGEVSCSGLHGANRMASNSLLECVVFAHSAFLHIRDQLSEVPPPPPLPDWDESQVTDSDEEVVVSHNWDEIRRFMWDYVSIVRTTKRLERAKHRIRLLQAEITDYYRNFRITNNLIELRNIALVSALIIESALLRKESRGLHFNTEYPMTSDPATAKDTILNWSVQSKQNY
ncbi:MAG: L-aspartate oxidase [Gammaproteobacteria bacterium RIFCSPLOWO2_02_FULL_56_15]|nr:MAG: L-aspartate oxidase [Gammaproteobacteria bacterium RIFCSPLOWO2_02_FULL_56_15]